MLADFFDVLSPLVVFPESQLSPLEHRVSIVDTADSAAEIVSDPVPAKHYPAQLVAFYPKYSKDLRA